MTETEASKEAIFKDIDLLQEAVVSLVSDVECLEAEAASNRSEAARQRLRAETLAQSQCETFVVQEALRKVEKELALVKKSEAELRLKLAQNQTSLAASEDVKNAKIEALETEIVVASEDHRKNLLQVEQKCEARLEALLGKAKEEWARKEDRLRLDVKQKNDEFVQMKAEYEKRLIGQEKMMAEHKRSCQQQVSNYEQKLKQIGNELAKAKMSTGTGSSTPIIRNTNSAKKRVSFADDFQSPLAKKKDSGSGDFRPRAPLYKGIPTLESLLATPQMTNNSNEKTTNIGSANSTSSGLVMQSPKQKRRLFTNTLAPLEF